MTSNYLIIGYGTVGNNLDKELNSLKCDKVDKYKGINQKKPIKYDIGFICVDTPLVDGTLDITEVQNAIKENYCEIYVIKSTVPVGTTEMFSDKKVIFSPEYYGATQHCNNFEFNFTILGGKKNTVFKYNKFCKKFMMPDTDFI